MTGTPDREPETVMAELLRLGGPRERASETARARARAAARDAWVAKVRRRTRRRWFVMLMPAMAAAALFAWLMPRPIPQPGSSVSIVVARVVTGAVSVRESSSAARPVAAGTTLAAGNWIVTEPGQLATLALAGGGELRMNSGTHLELTGRRIIRLDRGHVYIDSGAAKGSGLRVETLAGTIRDIGTRFDVSFASGALRVRVREGAISLQDDRRRFEIVARQQLVHRPGTAPKVTATETFGSDWDWLVKAAPFKVEGASLASYLEWIERESGRRIELSDPALRNRAQRTILHGSIDGLSLEESLSVILPASNLGFEIRGDRILIGEGGGSR